ncbi:MAG: hypothetical protein K2G12_08645, partial [Prevotella sp.]|nr:hypothetical protein [Prevotella sp.]
PLLNKDNSMIGSIIEIIIGYLAIYHFPKMIKAKRNQAKIIKLVGLLVIIVGLVNFAHSILQ